MNRLLTGAASSAIALASGMVVFAQTTQTPAPPPAGSGAPTTAQEPARESESQPKMTLVGCVQREAEYRSAKNAGAGGVAGTGVGAGNEFVLVNASASTGSSAAATGPAGADPARPSATPPTPEAVGTSGAMGLAYELTGSGESQLERYVGKRVEIVGKMKATGGTSDRSTAVSTGTTGSTTGATGATSTATGSASGRTPPPAGATDMAGQDLNLKEFEVVSAREVPGDCTPARR